MITVVIVYLAFHVGAGHAHYRYRKAHGLNPNFYCSSVRGPYVSVRHACDCLADSASGTDCNYCTRAIRRDAPLTTPPDGVGTHLPNVKEGVQKLKGQKKTEMKYCSQLWSDPRAPLGI